MKTELYITKYTPELATYIKSIYKLDFEIGEDTIAYYPELNSIQIYNQVPPCGIQETVSAGRLIDLILENQKKKLDFQILGQDVWLGKDEIKIACKTISFETLRRIQAEMAKPLEYEIPKIYAPATPEFWDYCESIKPVDFRFRQQVKAKFIFPYHNKYSFRERACLFGSSDEKTCSQVLNLVTPGQFIDALLNLKRKERQIAGLDSDKMFVRGDGLLTEWGRVSIADVQKLCSFI